MSDRNDSDYFERRARQERAIASTCEDSSVALAHLKLADAYEQRVRDVGEHQAMVASHS